MKLFTTAILLCFILSSPIAYCQSSNVDTGKLFKEIDKVQFFKEEAMLNVTVETYWNKVINQKNKIGRIFPARFTAKLNDSTTISEPVDLEVRGHFRRDYCYLPPLKLSFNKTAASKLRSLKSLKLVNACRFNSTYAQYIFKEFIVYKIYNLLTDKSFKVRLLNVEYKDSSAKKSPFIEPAFFIEDAKEMCKRNDCKEWKRGKLNTEATNRKQMTLVALFEYMIGNTDWSVPGNHNIKLVQSKEDSMSKPFSVPYDFDYAGIVNTDYAVPDPLLNTETVLQRVYRGYPRSIEELNEAFELFKNQKENIFALVNNFELLTAFNKKNMIKYLESFYELIKNPGDVKSIFITNARIE